MLHLSSRNTIAKSNHGLNLQAMEWGSRTNTNTSLRCLHGDAPQDSYNVLTSSKHTTPPPPERWDSLPTYNASPRETTKQECWLVLDKILRHEDSKSKEYWTIVIGWNVNRHDFGKLKGRPLQAEFWQRKLCKRPFCMWCLHSCFWFPRAALPLAVETGSLLCADLARNSLPESWHQSSG